MTDDKPEQQARSKRPVGFQPGNEFGKQYRWPKGVSGNPNGRPPGPDLARMAEKFLEEPAEILPDFEAVARKLGVDPNEPRGIAKLVVVAWVRDAIRGQPAARKDLLERVLGKVTDVVRVEGDPVEAYLERLKQNTGGLDPYDENDDGENDDGEEHADDEESGA